MIDKEMTRKLLLFGTAVALCALLAFWYSQLEWEYTETDLGPTKEVRQNPFFAVQALLTQLNIDNELVRGFSGLDRLQLNEQTVGPDDTLVLIHSYQGLTEKQINRLWQWVEDGGRLIITANNPYIKGDQHLPDALLERMGLSLESAFNYDWADEDDEDDDSSDEAEEVWDSEEADQPAPEDVSQAENDNLDDNLDCAEDPECQANTADSEADQDPCQWTSSIELALSESHPPIALSQNGGANFYDFDATVESLAADEDNILLAKLDLGAGQIYAYASAFSLLNEHIACHDNAFAFHQFVQGGGKVWLVLNASMPNFWSVMWRLSAAACIAFLLGLGLWVWQQATRFGPILMPLETGNRRFIDHIYASAAFLLRHQGNSGVITTLREDIDKRLKSRHAGFQLLSQAQQIEKIQQLSTMSSEDIDTALYLPLPIPATQFVDVVKRLQYLRNCL